MSSKFRTYLATFLLSAASLASVLLFVHAFRAELASVQMDKVMMYVPPVRWVHAHTGLAWLPQLWLGVALWLVAWLAAVAAFEAIARRVDPRDDAWTSLAWAMRSWRGWLQWLGIVLVGTAIGATAGLLPDPWFIGGIVPAGLAFASVVFLAANAANLLPARPPALWRLRWPGWFAVVAWCGAHAGLQAIGALIDAWDLPWAADIGIALLLWVPSVVVTLFCAIAWLNRASVHDAVGQLRLALRPRLIGAALVQQLRFGAIFAAIVLPILPMTLLLIFVVPQVEDVRQHAGGDLGPIWSTWVAGARWFRDFWWTLVLPTAWFLLVAANRLLVQLGVVAAATEPATPP